MRKTRYLSTLAACMLALGVAGASATVYAADNGSTDQSTNSGWGYGMGPGMMGGYGGGYGMGPGMMGGYGGGWGMGPGMMGGCGMHGMMGPFWGSGLNLTDAQQAKVNKIMDSTRKQHWALMGSIMDQQARLRDLYSAVKPDETAIGAAYAEIGKLHGQMYDTMVDAQKQMYAVLTKEQREQLRKDWRHGWGPRR